MSNLPPPPPPSSERPQRSMTRGRKQRASDLGGVCPKCGGTSFEAVRSTGRKVAFGFASLLAPGNEVRCITCGEKFKRG
jgi:DNA polymerase II large subunit